MKTTAVLFSITILSKDRLFVLRDFISNLEISFQNADVYAGINYNSIPEVEDILKNSNLKINFERLVNDNLYTESDAGAYQLALKILYNTGKQYDNYWFIHTKGAVNTHSDYLRNWYINNFIGKRKQVESITNQGIGSYGMLSVPIPENHYNPFPDVSLPIFENNITDLFPYKKIDFFYLHTFYVMCKQPMSIFLNNIDNLFFTTKLDKYYFEGVFPYLSSRTGHYTYTNNNLGIYTNSNQTANLSFLHSKWIHENELFHLEKYLNLPTNNYYFNQLNPPNAISNIES